MWPTQTAVELLDGEELVPIAVDPRARGSELQSGSIRVDVANRDDVVPELAQHNDDIDGGDPPGADETDAKGRRHGS